MSDRVAQAIGSAIGAMLGVGVLWLAYRRLERGW